MQDQTSATVRAYRCVSPTSEGVWAWKEAATLLPENAAAENSKFPEPAGIHGNFRDRKNSDCFFSSGSPNNAVLPLNLYFLGGI